MVDEEVDWGMEEVTEEKMADEWGRGGGQAPMDTDDEDVISLGGQEDAAPASPKKAPTGPAASRNPPKGPRSDITRASDTIPSVQTVNGEGKGVPTGPKRTSVGESTTTTTGSVKTDNKQNQSNQPQTPLPPGWAEVYSQSQARNFYYHAETEKTTWIRPEHPDAAKGDQAKSGTAPAASEASQQSNDAGKPTSSETNANSGTPRDQTPKGPGGPNDVGRGPRQDNGYQNRTGGPPRGPAGTPGPGAGRSAAYVPRDNGYPNRDAAGDIKRLRSPEKTDTSEKRLKADEPDTKGSPAPASAPDKPRYNFITGRRGHNALIAPKGAEKLAPDGKPLEAKPYPIPFDKLKPVNVPPERERERSPPLSARPLGDRYAGARSPGRDEPPKSSSYTPRSASGRLDDLPSPVSDFAARRTRIARERREIADKLVRLQEEEDRLDAEEAASLKSKGYNGPVRPANEPPMRQWGVASPAYDGPGRAGDNGYSRDAREPSGPLSSRIGAGRPRSPPPIDYGRRPPSPGLRDLPREPRRPLAERMGGPSGYSAGRPRSPPPFRDGRDARGGYGWR